MSQFFAETTDHKQRVVNAKAKAKECGDVEHKNGERGDLPQAENECQRDCYGSTAYKSGKDSSNYRAEHQQQGDDGEGNCKKFRTTQVTFADSLNIFIKDRATANGCLQVWDRLQAIFQLREELRCTVGSGFEENVHISSVTIQRYLPWIVGEPDYTRDF